MDNKKLNILVIEDEIIANTYLQSILEALGFTNLFEASNFNEALEIVNNNTVHLIFMDININGSIDGIISAKLLNEIYFIPIIYTTAYGDSQSIQEACETNLFGYLIKPFEKNQVESSLRIALKKINQSTHIQLPMTQNNVIVLENNQKYNLESCTFYIENEAISLTKKESDVLYILCKNLNQNISYEMLSTYIWQNKNISASTIRDVVSRLKKKAPNLKLETIINYGYILKS